MPSPLYTIGDALPLQSEIVDSAAETHGKLPVQDVEANPWLGRDVGEFAGRLHKLSTGKPVHLFTRTWLSDDRDAHRERSTLRAP